MNKEKRLELYEEVRKEIEKEHNILLSTAEIHSVVEGQFKIMMYGFSKDVGIHLPIFGKFVPFDMNNYAEKVIIPNKELQAKLREQGEENEATKVFHDSYGRFRKLIKEIGNEKEIDADTLIRIPAIDGSTDGLDIFKELR